MSNAGEFVDQVLEWDGNEEAAQNWALKHEAEILKEAKEGVDGPISRGLDSIERLAGSDQAAAFWGLGSMFASARGAASAAFHKLPGFVSAGARRVTPLWNALSTLFQKYAGKLKEIARKLGANGYTIALNIPVGFSLGLNFNI